jgi:hypothetical protein
MAYHLPTAKKQTMVNEQSLSHAALFLLPLSVRLLTVTVAVWAASCSSYTMPEATTTRRWLPFIIEHKTTKEEVLNRLGTPVNEYENGMIVSYILRENLNSELQLGDTGFRRDWNSEIYNLVLVFGPTRTLEKYSLVRVR